MQQSCMSLSALCALVAAGCASILGIEERKLGERECKGKLQVAIFEDLQPLAAVSVPATAGIVDYLEHRNHNTGGIKGCQIDYFACDTGYTAAGTNACYDEFRGRSGFDDYNTVFGFGTPVLQTLGPQAALDKKLVMAVSYNGDYAAPSAVERSVSYQSFNSSFELSAIPAVSLGSAGYPYVFFQPTDYSTAARAAVSFVASRNGKRLGFFNCEGSAYCTSPVIAMKVFLQEEDSSIDIGRDMIFEMSGNSVLSQNALDAKVLAYLTEEIEQNLRFPSYEMVDWIWIGNTRTTAAQAGIAIDRAVNALRSDPPRVTIESVEHIADTSGYDVKVIANNWALDEELDGACGGSCRGRWYGVQPTPLYGDKNATGMLELVEIHDAHRSSTDEHQVVQYVYGHVAALAWARAVEGVVARGAPVTGTNLKDELETFNKVWLGGLTASPISSSSSDHRPQNSVFVYRLDSEGILQRVGQPISVTLKDEWLGW